MLRSDGPGASRTPSEATHACSRFCCRYALRSLARSLIHLFAPDGGAGSSAGLDLSVAGADAIVFALALWGSAQLLLG